MNSHFGSVVVTWITAKAHHSPGESLATVGNP